MDVPNGQVSLKMMGENKSGLTPVALYLQGDSWRARIITSGGRQPERADCNFRRERDHSERKLNDLR